MDSFNHNLPESQGPSVNPYAHYQQTPRPRRDDSPALASASLIMGICALIFLTSGGFFIFGSLGILFALLSRGSGKMQNKARTGLAFSVAAFLIGAITLLLTLTAIFSNGGKNPYMEQFKTYYEYYTNGEEETPSENTVSNFFSSPERNL